MGNSIDSNATNLAFAEETDLRTLPETPIWYGLEPNTYSDFGATYNTVARTPITNTRQRAKGTITGLDAKGGFNTDLTQRNMMRLLQGFFFADVKEKPTTAPMNPTETVPTIDLTSVAVDGFLAAAGLDKFKVGHLVVGRKMGVAGNNGLAYISGVAAGKLTTTKVLTAEAEPPAAAFVQAVGFQFPATDVSLTVVGSTVEIASATIDLTTLGLVVGEWIFVGGDTALNRFAGNAGGYARVIAIAAGKLTLDMMTWTPVDDAGATANQKVQIFFGSTYMNAKTAAELVRRSYTLERQLGEDADGMQAEYLEGCIPNEFSMDMKTESKITADLSFVGLSQRVKTGSEGIDDGTRVPALAESAYNTSQDIHSMRLAVVGSATPLFGYATDLKIDIKNGVTANKALAVVGAIGANAGDFEVSGSVEAYFTSVAAINAIKTNADVEIQAIIARANAGIVIDIPLLSLGGGSAKIEKDKPVTVPLTQNAAQNPNGYTLLMSFFEYLPTVAMPD